MVPSIFLVILAMVVLVAASDVAVATSRRLALRVGVSAWVIGLTVTSIGTSLPELATSVFAAMAQDTAGDDAAGLALGNILGSNIFMFTGLLGVSALVRPLTVGAVKQEASVLLVSMAAITVFSLNGLLARWEGAILVVGFSAYIAWLVTRPRREVSAEDEEGIEPLFISRYLGGPRWLHELAWLTVFLGVVVAAANLLVNRGVEIAEHFGTPGSIVGVLVGVGTSLPEVVVSVRAASTGESDLALGNILGSSISNLCLCLGLAALASPLAVTGFVLTVDLPFLWATALAGFLLMTEQQDVTRREGGVLLTILALYLVVKLATGG